MLPNTLINKTKLWRPHGCWSVIGMTALPCIALIGCLYLLQSAPDAFAQDAPALTSEPQAPHRPRPIFIQIPVAETLYVQTISESTSITITYHSFVSDITSSPSFTVTDFLPAETSRVYTVPERFAGSATIAADALIVGANLQFSDLGNDAYMSFETEAPTVTASESTNMAGVGLIRPVQGSPVSSSSVPVQDRFRTTFCAQNISGNDALITVYYQDQSGAITIDGPFTVSPKAARCFVGPVDGSAAIVSDQPVFVQSALIEDILRGIRARYPATPYVGYSKLVYVPALFKQWELQNSLLVIQNTSSTTTTVVITYTDGITASIGLAPTAAWRLDQNLEQHAPQWAGGATISSTQPIAVGVAVFARDEQGVLRGLWSYTPPSPEMVNRHGVAFPVLFNGARHWNSTVHLYNPGSVAATVTPRYVNRTGMAACAAPFVIPAGQVAVIGREELPINFFEGMAYFGSTAPLAAVTYGRSTKPLRDITDHHFGYEAGYFEFTPGDNPLPCAPGGAGALPEHP